MKRILAILLVLVLIFGMVACGSGNEEPETEIPIDGPTIVMITDTGLLGDASFNDSAWTGVQKAVTEFGIKAQCLESKTADDYSINITSAVEGDADLIICVGSQLQEAVIQAAVQYPEQKFALIDGTAEGAANVMDFTFKEEEGSFLAGVAAAMRSQSGVIGYIGGVRTPVIEAFQYGFQAGVEVVSNKGENVIINYTESFEDADLGKEIAVAQHKAGADVIFHASGLCGLGLIEAAGEQEFWAIGVDQDQSPLNPEYVLCSMVKRVDKAAYLAIEKVQKGEFDGTDMLFSAANGGISLSDKAKNLPEEIKTAVDEWTAAMAEGKFVVPYDKATYDAFQVPAI